MDNNRHGGSARHTIRERGVFLPLLVAFLTLAGLFAVPAFAVHDTSAFELDGDAFTDLSNDWEDVYNNTTSGTTATSFVPEPDINASIFTGGGSKDGIDLNQWAWKDGAGGLPDKANLLDSFAARYSLDPTEPPAGPIPGDYCPNGTGDLNGDGKIIAPEKAFDPAIKCEVLYFGSDRYDNSGDAVQAFWFFQKPVSTHWDSDGNGTEDAPCPISIGGATGFCDPETGLATTHTDKDLLIISAFSNGGTVATIKIYEWDSTVSGNLRLLSESTAAKCSTASPADGYCGIVNPADGTPAPWSFKDKTTVSATHPANTYLQGEFFEGGVNLTTLGLGDRCFSSVASETRTSTSTTSVLKDFVLGGFGECETSLTTTPVQKVGDLNAGVAAGDTEITVDETALTPEVPFDIIIGSEMMTVTGRSVGTNPHTYTLEGATTDAHLSGDDVILVIPATGISIGSGSVSVQDSAILSVSGVPSWGGNLKFFLCGPTALGGDYVPCESGGSPIGSDQVVEDTTPQPILSAAATVTSAGKYCWRGEFTPDAATAAAGVGGDSDATVSECFTVNPVKPTITTNATNSVIGNPIHDTATLSGTATKPNGNPAGGTVTFRAYGPQADPAVADCTGTPAFTSAAIPVSGDGTYSSGNFTPTTAGTYRWIASYGGDLPNTKAVSGSCGDDNETSVVTPKTPTIVTNAVIQANLNGAISDTATIGNTAPRPGGAPAGGTVTFRAYGPNDATCTGTPAFTSAAIPVSGNGTYSSGNFTPTAVGTYRWIATYTGDLPNTTGPVTTACNDPNETSDVITASLSTMRSKTTLEIGGSLTDAATIHVSGTNPPAPSGTVSFYVCGPTATSCSSTTWAAAGTADLPGIKVGNNYAVSSPSFTPNAAGTWCFAASWPGDTNYTSGPYRDDGTNECFTVTPKTPTISTNAVAGPLAFGSAISDTATIGNTAPKPNNAPAGGTVTFRAYGPQADPAVADCTGTPAFTSAAIPVSGDGTYSSGNFTPTTAGTYRWIATYTGDLPNTTGPVTTACNDPNEVSVISPRTPTISTNAVAGPLPLTSPISDTATIGNTAPRPGGAPAGGTVTFRAYGPQADPAVADCTGTPAFTSAAIPVSGNGTYSSGNFTPTAVGTYRWIATYTGDLPNTTGPVTTACNDPNEVSVIVQLQPTISTAQTFTVKDSATITVAAGAGNLAGSVRFQLFDNATCTPGEANANRLYDSGAVTVSGASPQTVHSGTTTITTSEPVLSWLVEYTSTNAGHKNVTHACNIENSALTITNGGTTPSTP